MGYVAIPDEDAKLAHDVIGAAIEVHRILGPGFLESIYERALCHELMLRSIPFQRQQELIIPYKDIEIIGQRYDLLVGGRVMVELKTVESFAPIHLAKVLSYLKAMDRRLVC